MDLSISICTLNNRDFLRTCLASVFAKVRGLTFEILVVDNASTDGTAQMVQREFPGAILVRNRTNHGVASSRNQLVGRARGRYVLLLDADTELLSDQMGSLLAYMEAHPKVGVLGAKQINFNGQVYPAARTFPTLGNVVVNRLTFLPAIRASRALRAHLLLPDELAGPVEVDYLIGSFQMIRRELFDRVGLLDEGMFWGFEDADFCARLKKAGYTSVYFPAFAIRHYVQARTRRRVLSRTGVRFLWAQIESYARFYRKHYDLLWRRQALEG